MAAITCPSPELLPDAARPAAILGRARLWKQQLQRLAPQAVIPSPQHRLQRLQWRLRQRQLAAECLRQNDWDCAASPANTVPTATNSQAHLCGLRYAFLLGARQGQHPVSVGAERHARHQLQRGHQVPNRQRRGHRCRYWTHRFQAAAGSTACCCLCSCCWSSCWCCSSCGCCCCGCLIRCRRSLARTCSSRSIAGGAIASCCCCRRCC